MSSDNTSSETTDSTNQTTERDSTQQITIVGGPQQLFNRCNTAECDALVEATEPDAYYTTETEDTASEYRTQHMRMPTDDPLLNTDGNSDTSPTHLTLNGIDVLVCQTIPALEKIRSYEHNGRINTDTQSVILSELLTVKTDKDRLNTYLEGYHNYVDAVKPDSLTGEYTHISGKIAAGYCHDWDGLLVRGAGSGGSHNGHATDFLALTITADGQVTDETVSMSKLGIRAIDGVGPTTAGRLEKNGLETVDEVAHSSVSQLQQIKGLGKTKASRTLQSATAVSDGVMIPTSDTPVPGSEPVFIDIETDGLNPTVVWLIGVKNGVDGPYMSFITTDPAQPDKAVTAFMKWLKANASDRTLLTWNGWNFDYPVLREHIQKHAPAYLDTWKQASKRDLLRWARDLDNAVMPGRTNKLEHVAEGLGWSGTETGLSGAEVARQYRQWANDPCPETELDWNRHKLYCEGDVDALERIYTELCDASRVATTQTHSQRTRTEDTVQGGLFSSYE